MNAYHFSDLQIGMTESFSHVVTEKEEDSFRGITGDLNPLHRDDTFAVENGQGKFKKHVTFGMLTAAFYSTLAGMYLPGKYSVIHSLEIKFIKPVYAGDELKITGTISGLQDVLRLLEIKARIENQDGLCVSKAKIKVLLNEGGKNKNDKRRSL